MQETCEELPVEARTGVLTVLLAEDDLLVRGLCCAKLRYSYRVVEADTGDQALLLLQRGDIDVLVTDICMPGALDGWALAEQARLSHPHIPVVYASSRREEAARAVSRSLYVQKPYHPDEIIAAIQQLMP